MKPYFAGSSVRTRHDNCRWVTPALSFLLVCRLALAPGLVGAQGVPAGTKGDLPGSLVAGLTTEPATTEASQRPNWLITPSISVDGTYTDNVNLAANKKSDFVTRLNPGITLEGKSGRASASLSYQWQHYSYAENSDLRNNQRSLAAKGQLELVEKWLFLEGNHNISQQSVSAFGTQSAGNELINSNRSETAAYSISPYIKGRLASVADYQLRFTGTHARSDAGALSDGTAATTRSWNGHLAGATPLALLGWSLDADRQVAHNTNGVEYRSDHTFGTLTYKIAPHVRMFARAGRESENFTGGVLQKRTTSGLGLDWNPTERTKLLLTKDRDVADAYNVAFSHRTALSAWKFSDSRSLVVPTPQMALAPSGIAYDLLYLQLASSFPDPAARAAETNRQLTQAGVRADMPIFGSVMTSQAYIQRRRQASVALMGANNTVMFTADRSIGERMGTGIGLADDFALNAGIRQSGFNASWAHKMTPRAALTLNASTSRSTGTANLETTLKAWSLLLTTQLGAATSASLGLRQSRFDSTAGTGYDEHALTGAMQIKF